VAFQAAGEILEASFPVPVAFPGAYPVAFARAFLVVERTDFAVDMAAGSEGLVACL